MWLTFEDWLREFATVFICREVRFWHEVPMTGAWYGGPLLLAGGLVTGSTGGNNPQFKLTMHSTAHVFLTLSQGYA